MIAVDTSALLAIVGKEPMAAKCAAVLAQQNEVIISAGTLTETLIVAHRRNLTEEVILLLDQLVAEVAVVDSGAAHRAAAAHLAWGKGVHPAGLNFGDCFAYELAMDRGCPLLYVGDDFGKTDVKSAL
ncbi:MAG: type II toxin-antitoxin system VapC family toxin [Devosia sp.]